MKIQLSMLGIAILLQACAASEASLFGHNLAPVPAPTTGQTATIAYMTRGIPVACINKIAYSPDQESTDGRPMATVDAGKQLAVTTVMTVYSTTFMARKTCYHNVLFTPEAGGNYKVINRAEWDASVFNGHLPDEMLACEVTIYQDTPQGKKEVKTERGGQDECN